MLTFFLIYLLCGAVIGITAGLFGIGGGVIGIPVLLFLFNLQGMPDALSMHMAIGTMLSTVIVTTIVASYTHYLKGTINFSVFKKFILGAMIGSVIGITLSKHMNGIYLQKIFAIFLAIIALHMFLKIEVEPHQNFPGRSAMFIASIIFGILSGMLGLGGGVFMIPYFNWCGMSIRQSIATATACIWPVALIGSVGYMYSNVQLTTMPAWNSGFVYWPAFIGVSLTSMLCAPLGIRLAHRISTGLLKKSFALLLMGISVSLLVR